MRLIHFGWFYFGKMWKNMEKRPFFRADMAGLGKYCTGVYGRIGVYRVKVTPPLPGPSYCVIIPGHPLTVTSYMGDPQEFCQFFNH